MKKFETKLKETNFPSKQQRLKELWDVEGILHNQKFKFDLRPIKDNTKIGSFNTKADKMVFDIKDKWIIVDIPELHKYLEENDIKDVHLESLVSDLDWNIVLNKV
jgi:hypothetical protein